MIGRLGGEWTKRINSDPINYVITRYKYVFRHMKFHLPFRTFEIALLNHLQLARSQLHPNCQAYVMAFQITYQFLKLVPSVHFFFNIFRLLLQKEYPKLKQGHVLLSKIKIFRRHITILWRSKKILKAIFALSTKFMT